MKAKKMTIGLVKIVLLSILMSVLWAAFAGLFTNLLVEGGTSSGSSGQDVAFILSMMLVVSFVHTSILFFVMSRAAWRGIKLASTVALQIFGIQFLLTLSEAAYFDQNLGLPDRFAVANLLAGACMAVVFSLAAVAAYGAMKGRHELPLAAPGVNRLHFALKFLFLAALVYPLIYFLAGHFLAFRSEAVRIFYTDSGNATSFVEAARDFWGGDLRLFQTVRGAAWILIALPVIRMLKTGAMGTAVTVGLLFALLMNAQHLIPNQHMPAGIRAVHFIETASSNFVWGVMVSLLIRGRLKYGAVERADRHEEL